MGRIDSPVTPLVDVLPYESATEFIRLYGPLVTAGGLVLRHRLAPPEGSPVSFDLQLVDGSSMLQGKGLVRWSRREADGGGVLGIKFTSLEPESRRLLDLLMVTRGAGGRSDEPPPVPDNLALVGAAPPVSGFPRIAPLIPAIAPAIPPLAPRKPAVASGPIPVAAPSSRTLPAVPPLPIGKSPPAPSLGTPGRPDPGTAAVCTVPPDPTSKLLPVDAGAFTYSPAHDLPLDDTAARTGLIGLPRRPVAVASAATKAAWFADPTGEPSAVPSASSGLDLAFAAVQAVSAHPVQSAVEPVAPRTPSPPSPSPASEPKAPLDGRAAHARPVPSEPAEHRRPAEEEVHPAADPLRTPTPSSMELTPRDAASRGIEALRISRAIEALRRKEFDKAEAQLQQAIAEDPQNGRLRYELGLVYFEWSDARSRDHDGAAEAAFARAAELDPDADQPLVYLGQVQLRRHLWADARRSFTEALQRNPHSRGGTEGLEVLQGLQVRQTITRAAMAAAALLLVTGPLLWFGMGSSASQASASNGLAAAAPLAVAATTPAPVAVPAASAVTAPAPPAPSPIANAPAPAGQVTAAPSVLPEAQPPAEGVERDPGPARARRAAPRQSKSATGTGTGTGTGGGAAVLVRQGDGALREGKVDEALSHFTQALAKDPKHAPAHRGLGSVFVMQGKDSEALAAYRKYLTLAPNASDAGRIRALVAGME